MFDKDYFSPSLEADPDASIKAAWRTSEERGKALGDIYVEAKVAEKAAQARAQARRRREAARAAQQAGNLNQNAQAALGRVWDNANF
jgi:type IV secretory pathway VirB9-like protein